jgi:hypothetical protein
MASRTWPGGTPPAYNASPPSGSPDAGPTTSGTTAGAPGEWQITGVTPGDYFVRVVFGGNTYWSGDYAFVKDADLVHKAGTETLTGLKTFSAGLTVSGGPITLPAGSVAVVAVTGVSTLAQGGTGSATQNFVDLTTPQSVGGIKTFAAVPVFSTGLTVSPGGTITVPNGSIPFAAVAGLSGGAAGIDLGSSQIVTGQKTFDNDVPIVGGSLIASAITTPAAPVVTPTGTAGSTTYQYRIVATTYDGRDSINSATGQTTTGNATLSVTNYNALSWSAVTAAASYKVLKFVTGTWQLLAGGMTGTTYSDNGSATPSAYTLILVNPGGEITGTVTNVTTLNAAATTVTTLAATTTTTTTVQANLNAGGVTAGRFLGTVTGVAPTGGPYNLGDWVMDTKGRQWFCTVAGSPGTWLPTACGNWYARMFLNGTQTGIGSGAASRISCDTTTFDPAAMFQAGTFALKVPVAGKWHVSFRVGSGTAVSSTGDWFAQVVKNLSTAVAQGDRHGGNGAFPGSTGSDVISLAANDAIDLRIFNNTGTTCNILNTTTDTYLALNFVSAF